MSDNETGVVLLSWVIQKSENATHHTPQRVLNCALNKTVCRDSHTNEVMHRTVNHHAAVLVQVTSNMAVSCRSMQYLGCNSWGCGAENKGSQSPLSIVCAICNHECWSSHSQPCRRYATLKLQATRCRVAKSLLVYWVVSILRAAVLAVAVPARSRLIRGICSACSTKQSIPLGKATSTQSSQLHLT